MKSLPSGHPDRIVWMDRSEHIKQVSVRLRGMQSISQVTEIVTNAILKAERRGKREANKEQLQLLRLAFEEIEYDEKYMKGREVDEVYGKLKSYLEKVDKDA